ncbi:4-hydroxy-3-methylbut-2-en-1-yl diphosphate synthase [candidate division WOR-1 bacterium RIFOXYB2_FULL_42_35]|uniref:4-hydroxy-3-methylbut-2-en-1-yl diphosphate synthase (flavodoxin) n=1 Tax=candidate division WOR-1 bacterium RIFOXYC2_FULL_41_25 TaxID=1802586 RepID=A0A1F4TN19_UNCSA|nr:MAG: 4-hydroxy-3-methylbut-2-en-1-yl diphosphate synthase [candidate division WOR-1 bacterium RIFOXYA2_FULL_41_14]OGC24498.1 MAG: 4-hydroxy-3-methylbut-2-en-1-yl diphosphate synthase [candidate division WOR-1 bacterium RIFOXYB2_FULL_42_35]OGC34115.1 MAG: 4-hydroxy-3-methylbut-2-en-1-yl diphosphate synthase [candidate division WOR-1 bacterium RIFOXYC2_FULL_41_25]
MLITRDKTKKIKVGNLEIGGGNPIAVQSMTKTNTADIDATVAQIKALEDAGCQIVRCAVPDRESALALKEIKRQINIPLVADIHFNHEYALIAAEAGVDKLRINPGNIGDEDKIKAIVAAAKAHKIPIRVGVNSGSLERKIRQKYDGHVTAEGLVKSAMINISLLEKFDFHDIVVSIKATSVPTTIKAYELIAKKIDYPLHVGLTEAGIPRVGIVRSGVGIGAVLAHGIGDTIRVSLTGDPVEEVRIGYEILKSLELTFHGITVISCPTCGRTDIDVSKIASEIEEKTRYIKQPLTVAIMGCEVNGPGEAADADVGLAGGRGVGLIFREGEVVRKVPEAEMVAALLDEIESMAIK